MASPEELDALIAEKEIQIRLIPEDRVRRFITLKELEDFIAGELHFWSKVQVRDVNIQHLQQTREAISIARQQSKDQARNYIARATQFIQNNQAMLCSETAEGRFLSTLGAGPASGAYDYLFRGSFDPNHNAAYMDGFLQAMLRRRPDLGLANGLQAEIDSFQQVRIDAETFRNNLIAFKGDFTKTINEWKTSTEKDVRQWFDESRKAGEGDRASRVRKKDETS